MSKTKKRIVIVLSVIVGAIATVAVVFFVFRDFWAKIILDDIQYIVYEEYQLFNKISGFGSCNGDYYYDIRYFNNDNILKLYWFENADNNKILCSATNFIEKDNYFPYQHSFTINITNITKEDKRIKSIINNEEFCLYDSDTILGVLDDENLDSRLRIEIDKNNETLERVTDYLFDSNNVQLTTLPFVFR